MLFCENSFRPSKLGAKSPPMRPMRVSREIYPGRQSWGLGGRDPQILGRGAWGSQRGCGRVVKC